MPLPPLPGRIRSFLLDGKSSAFKRLLSLKLGGSVLYNSKLLNVMRSKVHPVLICGRLSWFIILFSNSHRQLSWFWHYQFILKLMEALLVLVCWFFFWGITPAGLDQMEMSASQCLEQNSYEQFNDIYEWFCYIFKIIEI